jgi:hypothetical protein
MTCKDISGFSAVVSDIPPRRFVCPDHLQEVPPPLLFLLPTPAQLQTAVGADTPPSSHVLLVSCSLSYLLALLRRLNVPDAALELSDDVEATLRRLDRSFEKDATFLVEGASAGVAHAGRKRERERDGVVVEEGGEKPHADAAQEGAAVAAEGAAGQSGTSFAGPLYDRMLTVLDAVSPVPGCLYFGLTDVVFKRLEGAKRSGEVLPTPLWLAEGINTRACGIVSWGNVAAAIQSAPP